MYEDIAPPRIHGIWKIQTFLREGKKDVGPPPPPFIMMITREEKTISESPPPPPLSDLFQGWGGI